eukprot:scaffold401579_cov34-Prasinocladus_malaysianus.AAC.1
MTPVAVYRKAGNALNKKATSSPLVIVTRDCYAAVLLRRGAVPCSNMARRILKSVQRSLLTSLTSPSCCGAQRFANNADIAGEISERVSPARQNLRQYAWHAERADTAQQWPGSKMAFSSMASSELYRTCDISGQVAFLTGASSGIGKATAWRLAEAGVSIVIAARRKDRLEKLKADIQAQYSVPIHVQLLDIRDMEAIKALPDSLPAEFKEKVCKFYYSAPVILTLNPHLRQVDILINNAGLALGVGPAYKANIDDDITMIETNVTGLMAMTRRIAPGMVERKKGHIINMSSVGGIEGYPGGPNDFCNKNFIPSVNTIR